MLTRLLYRVTQMVTLPNNTHVGLPTSVETFRAAVEQIRTALDQHSSGLDVILLMSLVVFNRGRGYEEVGYHQTKGGHS